MTKLVAQHLAKSYKSRQVVKDVSLSVEAGQVVGLLGPNGAGKTTTFYMIVGLVPNDKGLIQLDDIDLSHEPMHVRARKGIGYLPQESSIFRKLTVSQNIMSVLQMRKDIDANQQADLQQLKHGRPQRNTGLPFALDFCPQSQCFLRTYASILPTSLSVPFSMYQSI